MASPLAAAPVHRRLNEVPLADARAYKNGFPIELGTEPKLETVTTSQSVHESMSSVACAAVSQGWKLMMWQSSTTCACPGVTTPSVLRGASQCTSYLYSASL